MRPEPDTSRSRVNILLLQRLYDLVYLFLLALISPFLLYRFATSEKHRAGLRQRLGKLDEWPDEGPRIWIHGVSVGEVLAAKSLVAVLARELPDHEIVISTTTKTGQEVARKHYPGRRIFYYPLDFSWSTRKVLESVRPRAVILMELEIWPNFLLSTSVTEVPVLLVNGRISERSFQRYRILQRVIPEPMDRIVLYCVQTRTYEKRFLRLGVPPEHVKVTGTMKFDTIETEGGEELRREVLEELRIREGERVLMAGSTHPGEDEILYETFLELRNRVPEFRFVVVPRHPERIPDVEAMLRRKGARVVRKTRLAEEDAAGATLIVDTMGELARIYAAADIVFVGGSLVPHGGQNMMEPAGLGRPVVFGPHIHNFQESVDILLDGRAARMVDGPEELRESVIALAESPEQAAEMGARARQVVIDHQGASERIMDLIRPYCVARDGRETAGV